MPTLVANLTAPLLEAVAERLESPPATLICSGLLAAEIERVTAAIEYTGMAVVRTRCLGDWAGLLTRRAA